MASAIRVMADRASKGVSRCSFPSTWPDLVRRLVVAHSSRIMSGGTMGASLCTVNGMFLFMAERVGLIRAAR